MKALGICMVIMGIVLFIVSIVFVICFEYSYDKNFGQYLKLADDASTAKVKLDYFRQYKEAVMEIQRENAAYVFKQRQYTKSEQLKILDSLLKRLEDTSEMNEKSFEYQQAMYQISGQELNHTLNRINEIFKSCYLRSGAMAYWCIWNWIPMIIIFILGVILQKIEEVKERHRY